eukprot:scaffold112861_cov43-Attheya_sp.AAC.1
MAPMMGKAFAMAHGRPGKEGPEKRSSSTDRRGRPPSINTHFDASRPRNRSYRQGTMSYHRGEHRRPGVPLPGCRPLRGLRPDEEKATMPFNLILLVRPVHMHMHMHSHRPLPVRDRNVVGPIPAAWNET